MLNVLVDVFRIVDLKVAPKKADNGQGLQPSREIDSQDSDPLARLGSAGNPAALTRCHRYDLRKGPVRQNF